LKKLCGFSELPRLIGSANGYNLVVSGGKYWGIPQRLGPFDLTNPENRRRPELEIADTLVELESKCGGSLLTVLAGDLN
jgi:hypothetical protein